MLRYKENNQLHIDFHGATNATLDYIVQEYGKDALRHILQDVGEKVYKSIHDKLAKGDSSELIEHLEWFYSRENADYKIEVADDLIRLEVKSCPAICHLKKLGLKISKYCCMQTSAVNEGFCKDTPWESSLELVSEGHCIQIFRRQL